MKVLQLLTVLVKFGYYDDDDDVKEFLPAILKLLNGKDDYPSKKIKSAIEKTANPSRGSSSRCQFVRVYRHNYYISTPALN